MPNSLYNDPIWGFQGGGGGGSSGGGGLGQFAPQSSFLANPLAQAGIQGGGALLQTLFGNREGKRHTKWQNEQARRLMELFRGQLGSGPVISPQQIQGLTSQFREGARPTMDQLGFNASRQAGLSSPESHRLTANAQLPLLAQFQGGLARQNIGLEQQRDSQIRQLMAMMTRG